MLAGQNHANIVVLNTRIKIIHFLHDVLRTIIILENVLVKIVKDGKEIWWGIVHYTIGYIDIYLSPLNVNHVIDNIHT
jgi:hypothetical protein